MQPYKCPLCDDVFEAPCREDNLCLLTHINRVHGVYWGDAILGTLRPWPISEHRHLSNSRYVTATDDFISACNDDYANVTRLIQEIAALRILKEIGT